MQSVKPNFQVSDFEFVDDFIYSVQQGFISKLTEISSASSRCMIVILSDILTVPNLAIMQLIR